MIERLCEYGALRQRFVRHLVLWPAAEVSSEQRGVPCPYIRLSDAHALWNAEVLPVVEAVQSDDNVLNDGLALLVNQGELFVNGSVVFLQPDYVTRLLKPFVDHRLGMNKLQQLDQPKGAAADEYSRLKKLDPTLAR